ncbi:methionine adenosyltransferase [Hyphomicrobium sp.]|uniref:methionine adenosyltransferase n=1 Tax=Hyphomicrobium sp. TaxID=82 RepID=UPI001D45931C|nr:methionine adenosyltransferase [Hyphomicrobium sp.]MBY0560081.1 hypothetical protein [Hyphomicrobium sp.]
MSETSFEVVERKGRGHPDTICDLLAEHVSYDLGQFYLRECGRVLHYNVGAIGGSRQGEFACLPLSQASRDLPG